MPTKFYGEYPVLLWWAECVDLLGLLTPRNRARVLSLLADGVRKSAAMPDHEPASAWPADRLRSCGVRPQVPPRTWRCKEPGQKMRIIG